MICNVNDLFIEVDGKLFPAANIQVWDCSPEPHWDDYTDSWYGIYFEVMFEGGHNLTVYQDGLDDQQFGVSNPPNMESNVFIVEATLLSTSSKGRQYYNKLTTTKLHGEAALADHLEDRKKFYKDLDDMLRHLDPVT